MVFGGKPDVSANRMLDFFASNIETYKVFLKYQVTKFLVI